MTGVIMCGRTLVFKSILKMPQRLTLQIATVALRTIRFVEREPCPYFAGIA